MCYCKIFYMDTAHAVLKTFAAEGLDVSCTVFLN